MKREDRGNRMIRKINSGRQTHFQRGNGLSQKIQVQFLFGVSRARPSVAQELAAQVIGVISFALPGEPSGVEREIMGQFPSEVWVATRKSIARWISACCAVKPASDKAYNVWPVAKASLFKSGTV
jgi:hypothetical protein